MNTTRSRIAKTMAVFATVGLGLAVAPATSGAQGVVNLDGVASCNPFTGNQEVVWTFTNDLGQTVTITDASISEAESIDANADMSPTSVPDGGTSTGTTRAPGSYTGDYNLVITFTFSDSEDTERGEVVLDGGCVQTETSTTEAPTTTAAPTSTTAATGAVAVTPTYTG